MKRLLLAAFLMLALPSLRELGARTDISIDFFYDNLGDGGNWIEVGDYGYCWQPTVAVSNRGWRPYADGYWAYTDVGWTWVSYEDFGWATYHYGRWVRLRGRGWIWVPGREWAPAWVSWRTGGDYVGWAPLPPRGGGDVFAEFSPINSQVDIEFDIGPAYYNFIEVRYIGEPVLRERIFAAEENVTYITKTVNVTNITYTNSTVYNHGPDYDTVSRYSARPIQRLSLQREVNVDPLTAAQSKSMMKVQGDKLLVAGPQQFQKPPKPVAPKVVKEKIAAAQAPVERGWEPAGDAKAQSELKEKIKKEDPKALPPPRVKPREDAGQSAAAPPTTGTTPETASPPKDGRGEKPAASVAPSLTPGTSPVDKRNQKRIEKPPLEKAPDAPRPQEDPAANKRNSKIEPTPAPPQRDIQAESPVERPMPPEPSAPPNRIAPSEVPQKHAPKERMAPPAGPGPKAPEKQEGPRKRPDKNKPDSPPGQ